MPSIITHHYFAKEVYDNLPKDTQNNINNSLDIYYTFAQSHDYLFYYTFNFLNNHKIKSLGHTAHHQNTQKYILNIIKEIKKNNLEYHKDIIAYLYGTITHYCLDTTCHPYIFFKTGVWKKKKQSTKKYRGKHNHMEKNIDAIYYQKYNNKLYKYCNLNKEIIKNPKFSKNLKGIISKVYYITYNEKNIAKYYLKGIRDTKIINFLFINDYLGIKELIYKLIDKFTKNHFGNLQSYSTHNQNINYDYLNNEHKPWYHPVTKKEYTTSFADLYHESLNKALLIIKEVNNVLYNNKDINKIKKYIPDLDYSTGLEIKRNTRMKYFSF